MVSGEHALRRPGQRGVRLGRCVEHREKMLVTSDAHAGLVAAIGATLPGASWQRCRTHYAVNLLSVTAKASWPWVRTLLHSVYDQPDATAVHEQYDRVLDVLSGKLPAVAEHLDAARAGAPTSSGSSPTAAA